MRANPNDKISPLERENKKTIIIVVLSTLLFGALAIMGIMRTEIVLEKEKSEQQERLLAQSKKVTPTTVNNNATVRNQSNKPQNVQAKISNEKKATSQVSGMGKPVTLSDLKGVNNPVTFYEPPKHQINRQQTSANSQPKKRQNTSIKQTANWQWATGSGSNRKIERGIFYYTIENGVIETSRICNNYQGGSITYRSCRKGAKEYFKNQCSIGKSMECNAANMRA